MDKSAPGARSATLDRDAVASPVLPDQAPTESLPSGSKPPCVMIIDDSRTIRRSAKSLLAREGWDVVTAEDGFDALAKVVEYRPDIVFVDIMMPRLDGYQTCALIKNNEAYRGTPVIMLSSKDSIFDKARGRVVGSEHYLTKPFTREDLLGTIARHLPETSSQPLAPATDPVSQPVTETEQD